MQSALIVGYRQAWLEGAGTRGITLEELTDQEREALRDAINGDFQYILGIAGAIGNAPHADERAELASLYSRGELWVNRYNAVKAKAQLMADQNQKLRWDVGPTEHCRDCAMYNGRVYRASIWSKYNIAPQSHRLACWGGRCQCRFNKTTQPCTPGKPPQPRGKAGKA